MAKKTYSNSANPKAMSWAAVGAIILAFGFYILFMSKTSDLWDTISICTYIVFYGLGFWFIAKSAYLTVDEDAGTVFTGAMKKYPMPIASIQTITYKETKRGRFRSLFVHDNNVGFFEYRTSLKKADEIVTHLTSLNPAIEIKHANYL